MLDMLELQEESKRLSEEGKTGNYLDKFIKFPEKAGAVVLRILPPASKGKFDREKNPLFQATRTHRLNGKSFHCPRKLENNKWTGKCPICMYYSYLWKESEKDGVSEVEAKKIQERAKTFKPLERYYYNAIQRNEVNEETGKVADSDPKIFSIGKSVHQIILDNILGNAETSVEKLGDVTSYKDGRDFKFIKTIKKSGKEEYPNYDSSKFLEESAIDPDLFKSWMEKVHDLVSLREVKSEEELSRQLKIHLGIIKEENKDGFDPSEYSMNAVDNSSNQTTENETVVKTEVKNNSSVSKSSESTNEDEGLVDEDFLNSLKELSN